VVSTVATPAEWQCKIRTGGVRRLAVANGPNIFQMLLVYKVQTILSNSRRRPTFLKGQDGERALWLAANGGDGAECV